jgi:predicted acylesterase/phospholipase RssA
MDSYLFVPLSKQPTMRTLVPPRRLLFSGGGIRVICFGGALQALHQRGLLAHCQEFCGVSAGSLASLMLALGYSINSLKRFVLNFDFGSTQGLELDAPLQLFETFGLDSGHNLERVLERILHYKGFPPDITFQGLKASGRAKSLRVWAADIQHLCLVEFSAEKTPNIPVLTAVRASCSIPIYFTPVVHPDTKTLLVDGGLYNNFPIDHLTADELQTTLGISFDFTETPLPIHDFLGFTAACLESNHVVTFKKLVEKHKDRVIIIPRKAVRGMQFEVTSEQKQQLFHLGETAVEAFFSEAQKKPSRRHSIA